MRSKLGMIFLLLTIALAVTALNQGGFWWLAVMISCALALWGTGGPREKN